MTWMENQQAKRDVKSLSLIDLEEYCSLYSNLKKKYGPTWVNIWPEKTDPSKFVYEDIAIATYLILLWKNERERLGIDEKQSFVDLGCGNGLLVYLLVSEGHPGLGIDLRKRGIWDLFPENTTLKVQAITPSDTTIFPDTDWIIGNHSDELSPWIPVIAARSSYKARYFILPCCAFEFNGEKYQRSDSQKSQYDDFLQYVERISVECGFETLIDRLKIPSTKRVCLIGMKRTYEELEMERYSTKIQEFIDLRCKKDEKIITEKDGSWNKDFIPRSDVERVRNCTQINKGIVNEIVDIMFNALTAKRRYLPEYDKWNVGGNIKISEIAALIPSDKLKAIKSECGGLQTLIKNNHQIFQVVKGIVELRVPTKIDDKSNKTNDNIVYQQKECWFHSNHPDGCPLQAEDCCFKH